MNNTPDPTAMTPIPVDRMPLGDPIPLNARRKPRKGTGRVAVAIYAAIVAGALGVSAASEPTTPVANEGPAPQPTVTVTAKPAPAEPKPAVPQVCLIALNQADKGFSLASETMDNVQGVFKAIETLDFDAATPYLNKQETVNEKLHSLAPMYNNSKAQCREAAK